MTTSIGQQPVFFVLQRQNGLWSVAAKIVNTFDNEVEAEAIAAVWKLRQPDFVFGVAKLRSEARAVANPVVIVRLDDPQ